MQLTGDSTICSVWRNESGRAYAARVRKELRDLCSTTLHQLNQTVFTVNDFISYLSNSANIFIPRLFVEPEVLVEAEANIIAVQTVTELFQMEEVLLKRTRDSGLHELKILISITVRAMRREPQHAFPLALRPVNQIVIPFCESRRARSGPSTEPVK